MDDVRILNRDELQSLLRSDGDNYAKPGSFVDSSLDGGVAGSAPVELSRDAPTTNALDLSTITALQRLFAARWGKQLEQRLRSIVQVRLEDCAVRENAEFVFGLERPTTFQVLRAEPLSDPVCLEISPSLIFPMFDRLLGGPLRGDTIVRRPLTEIELRLLSRVTKWLMAEMTAAWGDSLGLAMGVETVDCNPRMVRCYPSGTKLVVCHFDVDMRFARGSFRMAFSCDSVAELDDLIQRQRRGELPDVSHSNPMNYRLYDDHAELAVVLAETTCSAAEITQLQVGDVLQTETLATSLAHVRVDDETIYLARAGQYHGKRAFRIEQRVLDESG